MTPDEARESMLKLLRDDTVAVEYEPHDEPVCGLPQPSIVFGGRHFRVLVTFGEKFCKIWHVVSNDAVGPELVSLEYASWLLDALAIIQCFGVAIPPEVFAKEQKRSAEAQQARWRAIEKAKSSKPRRPARRHGHPH